MKKTIVIPIALLLFTLFFTFKGIKKVNLHSTYEVGQAIDSLNHVIVYFNGGVDNVEERNTKDGYNLGLKYQCVEFVKRYYFEKLNHRMPETYGHAKTFFNPEVKDGALNQQRDLVQFHNPGKSKPQVNDLLVMDGTVLNRFGHVAIVSQLLEKEIEIIQQNPGPFEASRDTIKLINTDEGKWELDHKRVLGWLRKDKSNYNEEISVKDYY